MSIANPNHRFGETMSGSWQLDPQRSSVEFRVRHFWGLITVKGHFDDYHGQLELSASPAIELTINAASLQTGNRKRDQHLRSTDFFDAEEAPARAVRLRLGPSAGDTLKVRGRLSARGRSIPVELERARPPGRPRARDRSGHNRPTPRAGHDVEPAPDDPGPRSELFVKAYLMPNTERAA